MELALRVCPLCDKTFAPRYQNKGFFCSSSCYQKDLRRGKPRLRTPLVRRRDTKWMNEARRRNPEKYLAIERNSRRRARERLGEEGWKRRNKHYNLLKFGITLADFDQMLKDQNNSCAICGGPPKNIKGFQVDHNHETGAVRGLLCHSCNQGMKALDKTPNWCEKAAKYAARKGRA